MWKFNMSYRPPSIHQRQLPNEDITMSDESKIKPGMLVLWRSRYDSPPLSKERFLGFVVEELKEKERFGLRRASRQFSVFVRTLTTQDKKVIIVPEYQLVPFFEKKE